MYKFPLTVALSFITGASLFAQLPSKPKPVSVRRVNGVVRDSLGKAIPAAAVRLVSPKDTLHALSSEYGVFNFSSVHSENFTVEVQMSGYHPYLKRYFLNDTKPILVLPPLVLTSTAVQLKGIVVTTEKGPQQRGDTTEFWAKDYIVRDYARLEDMLKRMEGFSTDANGQLSYNGKPVNKALFNGTRYFDGDVAAAIKELPADIVERIQVIQENENGTGPKTSIAGPSSQTLNIVTKPDKSAAKMYQVSAGAGTEDRYSGTLSAKSIDGVKMWGVAAGGIQEPLGVKTDASLSTIGGINERLVPAMGGGGSAGTLKGAAMKLDYTNKIGQLSYTVGYTLNRTRSLNEQESMSEEFYKDGSLKRNTKSRDDNTRTEHGLTVMSNLRLKNFSMMTHLFAGTGSSVSNTTREIRQTGILDNLQQLSSGMRTQNPTYRANTAMRFFETNKLMLDVQLQSDVTVSDGSGNDNTDIYGAAGGEKPDSSLYLLQRQKSNRGNHSMGATLRYAGSEKYQFSLNVAPGFLRTATINYRDEVTTGQPVKRLNDLSNDEVLLNYRLPSFLSVTYNFSKKIELELKGEYQLLWQQTQLRLKGLDLSTRSGYFTPNMAFKYRFSDLHLFTLLYNRNVSTPSLLQLNPKPYYTTPFDVTFGNPDLKNGVNTNISGNYINTISGVGLNINIIGNYSFTNNGIGANRVVRVDSVTNTIRTETYYLNVKGGDTKSFRCSFDKNLKPMNMALRFNGQGAWTKQLYFADGNLERTDQRNFNYDFSALMTPVKWLDLTAVFNYSDINNKNSLQPGRPLYNNDLSVQLTAAIFLPAEVKMNINARQTVSRASSLPVSQHPFILNANIEKRFLKKKDAIISFTVMDAFQQNNYNIISQSATGFSNAITNPKSRYFLCQLAWNPQRFSRSKSATGSRRGDGSFAPVN